MVKTKTSTQHLYKVTQSTQQSIALLSSPLIVTNTHTQRPIIDYYTYMLDNSVIIVRRPTHLTQNVAAHRAFALNLHSQLFREDTGPALLAPIIGCCLVVLIWHGLIAWCARSS